jgi:glycosyltransferase involved in cell wall biosynthesis
LIREATLNFRHNIYTAFYLMKKILLSAFGCAPNRGSDAEVGWKWVITLADMGHEVWVITREVNRESIEAELVLQKPRPNLHFIFFEKTRLLRWTTGIKGRIYFYYYVWQWGAYQKALAVHKEVQFDVVHHITWVSIRQPSFMGNLGIPFYFGPVAGGEAAPWQLRRGYNLRQWAQDILRDLANLLVKVDPLMWWTFFRATKIYVTSEQTCQLLPRAFRRKAQIQLAIASDYMPVESGDMQPVVHAPEQGSVHILYVGRFIGWKGMHLGLRAFKELLKQVPGARLTLVGRGPDENEWRALASRLSIDRHIEWVPWLDRQKLSSLYLSHDIFLFPSLHDSGGLVVLEAMGHGLPVVCLDLGGPGVIVNGGCGIAVKTAGMGQEEVVAKIAKSLLMLTQDTQLRANFAHGTIARAKQFNWISLVERIHGSA